MPTYLHDAQTPREPDPETGLPIGPRVTPGGPARRPERVVLDGRYCRLEPLEADRHADELFLASTPPDAVARFQYLPVAAPATRADFDAWVASSATAVDRLYFAVVDKRSGAVAGRQSLMRIDPANRSIEIGDIYWGPAIARSPVTTEANFLFARYAFDTLGYWRYEWKCNALNGPSRQSAERFGFTYEGLFRRSTIVRGRTRDTTWFAMIAEEWPALRTAYETWLAPENFDGHGGQRQRLSDLTRAALAETRR
ncbi:MAG TPA: GNAT family protein [Hyphomicrobiaceae bacterium]|nr:GNAT family protein [Hyphomicrobiaceae bacterium]